MADPVGQESSAVESLSPYAAPYVTEMLGRGQALASTPYQAYTGPLTAGPSQLQQQAFGGLGSLALPAASAAGSLTGAAYQPLSPQQIAGGETSQPYAGGPTSPVQAYMNPYLQAALEPQYAQARRQADIAQQALQSQYAKAGAYGGSRQGVAEAELQSGLLNRLADITGQGYQQAYDRAADLFGQERQYGLEALRAQQTGGAQQRAIEQQGIGADIAQFQEERDYPYKQVQYMQSLLQGLPIEAVSREYVEPSSLSTFLSDLGLLGTAGQLFFGQGAAPGGQAKGLFRSDIRLKENITHVGVLPNGANWYTWDWNDKGKAIAGNQPTQGVMAQEIQKTNPDAVTTDSDGYLRVDYSKV
jgi:hypothetical protein